MIAASVESGPLLSGFIPINKENELKDHLWVLHGQMAGRGWKLLSIHESRAQGRLAAKRINKGWETRLRKFVPA